MLRTGPGRRAGGAGLFEQFGKERPVREECLPLLFCPYRPLLAGVPDDASLPVVVDELGVINGDQIRLMVEIVHRITAVSHDPGHEPVRSGQGLLRRIDESGLDLSPLLCEGITINTAQRLKLQTVPLVDAFSQLRIGLVRVTGGGEGAVIFGTKLLSKLAPATPTADHRRADYERYKRHHNYNHSDHDLGCRHELPPSPFGAWFATGDMERHTPARAAVCTAQLAVCT